MAVFTCDGHMGELCIQIDLHCWQKQTAACVHIYLTDPDPSACESWLNLFTCTVLTCWLWIHTYMQQMSKQIHPQLSHYSDSYVLLCAGLSRSWTLSEMTVNPSRHCSMYWSVLSPSCWAVLSPVQSANTVTLTASSHKSHVFYIYDRYGLSSRWYHTCFGKIWLLLTHYNKLRLRWFLFGWNYCD